MHNNDQTHNQQANTSKLLKTEEAVAFYAKLGYPTTVGTMNQRRHDGTGPDYCKIGRLIFYTEETLTAWLKKNQIWRRQE